MNGAAYGKCRKIDSAFDVLDTAMLERPEMRDTQLFSIIKDTRTPTFVRTKSRRARAEAVPLARTVTTATLVRWLL